MKVSVKYVLVLLALSSSFLIKAQDDAAVEYSKFPLKIAVGSHVVGFPFENLFSSFNPHLSIGTERRLNKNRKHLLLLSSQLGLISNEVIGNTITADLDFGYRHTGRRGLFSQVSLGLGILDQFQSQIIYRQDISDGTYKTVKNKGRFSSLIGFKTGFGYDFSIKKGFPFAIGITHDFFIQTSYFNVASFPIMPQSTTNILIIYKFKK